MEAATTKRGVYPLHGYKIGLYRLPIKLEDLAEIKSIHDGLKKAFEMDMYADRIYATYRWQEQNKKDSDAKGYEEVELSITVEIVTGEVVDIIYQIFPIEKFGDPNWVLDYRKKADHFAKMVIDTILRNTILADKMISYYVKTEKISEIAAIQKLEELTPLAKIVLGAKAKAIEVVEEGEEDEGEIEIPDGAKPGPIDVEYKSKMKLSAGYDAAGYTIKTWGRRGTSNGIMGVWGEFVSVDYDICIADGGCIEACPVDVYEWFDTPGNPASDKKPLMSKEPDCIFCLACEGVCPPQAIKIYEIK
jgi:NAD-dependent dihydropyrimidine dehydrogenase PreA subunit/transcription termination factor NusB